MVCNITTLPLKDMLAFALLAIAVIAILAIIGRYALAAVRAPRALRPVAPALGLSVIVAIAWPLQFMGVSIQALSAGLVVLAIAGVIAPVSITRLRPRGLDLLEVSRGELWALAIAVISTTAFLEPALHDFGLTLASLGNADPVSYSLDARATLESGYATSPGVLNRDLNVSASWNWPGAVTIQGLVAGITGRPAGLASLLTIGMVSVLGQLQTAALVQRLVPSSGRTRAVVAALAPLVAVVAWLNPFMGYVVGNGFLAQLIAMALVIAILVILSTRVPQGCGPLALPTAITLGLLAGAAIGTFAAVAPIVIVIFVLVTIAIRRATAGRIPWPRVGLPLSVATLTALLAGLGGLLWFSYNGVLVTTGSTAGWPLPAPGFATVFGVTALLNGAGSPSPFGPAGWLGLTVVLLILAAGLRLRDPMRGWRVGWGVTALLMMAAASLAFGPDAYKTWKLWAFVAPILVACVVAVLVSAATRIRAGRRAHLALVAAVLAAVVLAANGTHLSAQQWGRSQYTFGATTDRVALLQSAKLLTVPGVNVYGTSVVDTMMSLLYAAPAVRVAVTESFYPALPSPFKTTLAPRGVALPPGLEAAPVNESFALWNAP